MEEEQEARVGTKGKARYQWNNWERKKEIMQETDEEE
jgi:hypothetical protein